MIEQISLSVKLIGVALDGSTSIRTFSIHFQFAVKTFQSTFTCKCKLATWKSIENVISAVGAKTESRCNWSGKQNMLTCTMECAHHGMHVNNYTSIYTQHFKLHITLDPKAFSIVKLYMDSTEFGSLALRSMQCYSVSHPTAPCVYSIWSCLLTVFTPQPVVICVHTCF